MLVLTDLLTPRPAFVAVVIKLLQGSTGRSHQRTGNSPAEGDGVRRSRNVSVHQWCRQVSNGEKVIVRRLWLSSPGRGGHCDILVPRRALLCLLSMSHGLFFKQKLSRRVRSLLEQRHPVLKAGHPAVVSTKALP